MGMDEFISQDIRKKDQAWNTEELVIFKVLEKKPRPPPKAINCVKSWQRRWGLKTVNICKIS